MRLLIRPKTIPGPPIARHRTDASFISWFLRLPEEVVKQVAIAIWEAIRKIIGAIVHLTILTVIMLLVCQPRGGVKEAIDMTHPGPLGFLTEALTLIVEGTSGVIVIIIVLSRALPLVRKTYSFTIPPRKERKKQRSLSSYNIDF